MRQHVFAAAIAALVSILAYLPALRNGFLDWDDPLYVTKNQQIRNFDLTFLKWAFSGYHASNWHPLTWIAHSLDYLIWGMNPAGHHAVNLLIHGINVAVLVFLIDRLLEAASGSSENRDTIFLRDRDARLLTAGFCGLLFGVHPVHVESVAWIAERKDLLCALFYLASLLAYIHFVRNSEKSARISYWTSVCFYVLSLLSKPMAVSLPLILLLLDWYPLQRFEKKRLRSVLLEKLPFLLLAAAVSVVTVFAQKQGNSISSLVTVPFSERGLVAFQALIAYLGDLLWPYHLIPFYPYPTHISLLSYAFGVPLLIVLMITCCSVFMFKKNKLWPALWCYYVITLAPVLGIVQVGGQARADRYTYLPSIAPLLAAALGIVWCLKKLQARAGNFPFRTIYLAFVSGLIFILALFTAKQTSVWKDNLSLWSSVIESTAMTDKREYRNFEVVYHNHACALEKAGRTAEALNEYSLAIALTPNVPGSYINRAVLLVKLQDLKGGLEDYNAAIALKPGSAVLYYNRGNVLARLGQAEAAIRDYTKAITLASSPDPDYFHNRGVIYRRLNRFAESARDFALGEQLRHRGNDDLQ